MTDKIIHIGGQREEAEVGEKLRLLKAQAKERHTRQQKPVKRAEPALAEAGNSSGSGPLEMEG